MSDNFDPYHQWLGISPRHRPPTYYQLLRLEPFESDVEVIKEAAERQMSHVRTFSLGPRAEHSQRLLNELAQAKICLTHPAKKAAYDQQLKQAMAARKSPLTTAPPAGAASTSPATEPAADVSPLGSAPLRPLRPALHRKSFRHASPLMRRLAVPLALGTAAVVVVVGLVAMNRPRGESVAAPRTSPADAELSPASLSTSPLEAETPTPKASPSSADTPLVANASAVPPTLPASPAETWLDLTEVAPDAARAGHSMVGLNRVTYDLRRSAANLRRYICAHAPSVLVYRLPPGARRFRATCLLTNPGGSVSFIVRVNGVDAFQTREMRGSVETERIDVPLPRDARVLELRVDDLGSNHWDHSFWLEPELLIEGERTPDSPVGEVLATSGLTRDLLPLIDLDQHVISGKWTWNESGSGSARTLVIAAAGNGRLMLPVAPQGDYQLTIRCRTTRPGDQLHLVVPAKGRHTVARAIEPRIGLDDGNERTVVASFSKPDGKLEAEVKINSVVRRFYSSELEDGQLRHDWHWMPHEGALGLKSVFSRIEITAIELTMTSGEARRAEPVRPFEIRRQADDRGTVYVLLSPSPWESAQVVAKRLGGNLVTLNNAEEDRWLYKTFSTTHHWLGLTDRDREGRFTWVSGDSAVYRRWLRGEPNNAGQEDYAVRQPDGWNDASGEAMRYSIVEIPP